MEMVKFRFRYMQNLYVDHPAEDALERFVLHRCPEEELETVETHILACDMCVERLEALENQIADLRMGYEQLQRESAVAVAQKQHRSWKTWFTVPNLAWAGAAAVIVAGLAITPQLVRQAPVAEISLSAYRGTESALVPESRPLHVQFNNLHLPEASVIVQLVNDTGKPLWQGNGVIRDDRVAVMAPKIGEAGSYYFRIYSARNNQPGELLREFALQVK
jgi:hypothetical protein